MDLVAAVAIAAARERKHIFLIISIKAISFQLTHFGFGEKSFSIQNRKMSSQKADLIGDIVVPTIVVLGMFIINAIVFFVIMRKRKLIVYEDFNMYEPIGDAQATPAAAQNIEMTRM